MTWLLTITRNCSIDALRVRRATPVDDSIFDELLSGAAADPQDLSVSRDQAGRLRAELARLPVEQRRAVVLATVLGWTSGEIADWEGVPVPTAKTRLRTGLLRLRARMTAEVDG